MVVISKHGRYNVEKYPSDDTYCVVDTTNGLAIYIKPTYDEAKKWAEMAERLYR
jgi:hypothetical protein